MDLASSKSSPQRLKCFPSTKNSDICRTFGLDFLSNFPTLWARILDPWPTGPSDTWLWSLICQPKSRDEGPRPNHKTLGRLVTRQCSAMDPRVSIESTSRKRDLRYLDPSGPNPSKKIGCKHMETSCMDAHSPSQFYEEGEWAVLSKVMT